LPPRTRQIEWYDRFSLEVAPVYLADTCLETVLNMMLRSTDISEHSGAETALVSHDKIVQQIANIVARKSRHNLMMDKSGMTFGNESTLYAIHTNITSVLTHRFVSI